METIPDAEGVGAVAYEGKAGGGMGTLLGGRADMFEVEFLCRVCWWLSLFDLTARPARSKLGFVSYSTSIFQSRIRRGCSLSFFSRG